MHPTETEKAQHTAEPWQVKPLPNGDVFIEAHPDLNEGHNVAECFGPDAEANAERIVACVNACAGIPDPASAVPALVKALEKLLPLAESGRVHHGKFEDTQPIMDQARAALALAQGGKR